MFNNTQQWQLSFIKGERDTQDRALLKDIFIWAIKVKSKERIL